MLLEVFLKNEQCNGIMKLQHLIIPFYQNTNKSAKQNLFRKSVKGALNPNFLHLTINRENF